MRAPTTLKPDALDPLRAGAEIEEALDREEIFELLLRATRSRLGFAALLLVTHDRLRGWRVLADAAFETRGVDTLELPRSIPAFERVIATAAPAVGPIESGDMFVDGLLELLGGHAPTVLAFPICARRHTLALVIAHDGPQPFSYADVADLFPLLADADSALDRVLTTRARSAAERAPSRADSTEYEIEVAYDEELASRRAATVSHREARSWRDLADSIRRLIRDGVDHGDPGEDEQLELLLELGQVEAEHLGRPEAAIEAWRSALAIDASDERVLDALERLYVQRGRWFDCVELLEKRAALLEDEGARIAMLLNLAAIARDQLNDPRRAAEAYERIVEWEPGHPVASKQLEALYRARQEWGPVAAQMLDRASRDSDPRTSLDALVEVAKMYEHKVGDPRAAVLVWLTVLRRAPERMYVLDDVERLAEVADDWEEVIAESTAVATHLERTDAEVAARLWRLVGSWSRDHAADRDGAIRALERALSLEVAELESELHVELGELHEANPAVATAHYERALVSEPEATRVLTALHRLYLASQTWPKIANILPRLIDALAPSAPVAVIVDLHIELGAVYADRLDRPDDAIASFQDALALDPAHQLASRSLSALYERTGQAESLLELGEAEIDRSSREQQLQRYPDLAAAWHEHQRFDRAVTCWRKLLALDPSSAIAQVGLERSLRSAERWIDLIAALRARSRQGPGTHDRLVLLELAEVQETRLDDTSGAIATLEEITAQTPDDPAALDALARLYDRAGRLRPALDALERLLAQVAAGPARADLYHRVGRVHLAARDAAAARLSLVQALALDRENANAREAMARVYLQQGELVAAGEELLQAARLHDQPPDILRCLADAATLYRHRLADTDRARECLHRILEMSPDDADAKQALAELLHDNQEWETLWPHLEEQVAHAEGDTSRSPTDRRDVFLKAARCAVELARFPRAMELYELAARTAPDPAISIERAEALYRSKSLEAAVMSLLTLVTDVSTLERPQRIAVFRRLAQIQTELGKPAAAEQFHTKVLNLDPAHRDTLADLAELQLANARHDEAILSLRELAAASPVPERVALLERIGDLYRHQLANPSRATSTYFDALELDHGNRRVLQRLLDMQTEGGQWTRAVETIQKFLEHETDPARRAAYHLAAARIRRSQLRDLPGALADHESALDELLREQPLRSETRQRAIEVFQEVDALITAEHNWKALEQAYRRMIKRIAPDDPILVPLWHALGELYRTRLDHPESAISAFEVAHSLDPDKAPVRTRLLAELYAKIGAPAQATTATAMLAESDPTNPDIYRQLLEASVAAGHVDEAWCACRVLVFLKQATFEEEQVYKKYIAAETRKATTILDDAAWANVRHPDEDRVISSIFALIWESLVALRAGSAKSFELRPKDLLPLDSDDRVLSRCFRHAARILNVSLPDVYVQPRRPGSLLLANCIEKTKLVPAVIVGRDMMTGYRDTEIAAAVAALVALLRPTYYLELAMSTNEELEAAVAAAALLVGREVGRPELAPLTEVFAPAIKAGLTRPAAEALLALVERLEDRPDLARWRAAVETAAARAAFLASGELAATARMTSPKRVHDLISYSVSPGYFALRKHLGVAIVPRR